MRNLPFRGMNQNRIWLAVTALATELLAWTARLALTAAAALYELKRLRLRILATAGRLVRTARRHVLHIDPPTWPWANVITPRAHPAPGTACALNTQPDPTTKDRSTGRPRRAGDHAYPDVNPG